MARIVLKDEVLKTVMGDPLLFGKVADAMGYKPASLIQIIKVRAHKLATASVLKVLREHLQVEDKDLLIELQPVSVV